MTTRTRDLDLLCIGETMGLIVADQTGPLGGSARIAIGGAESNAAIAAARLGARVAWVSRVGSDPLGDLIVRSVRGEGVEVWVERDETRPTGLMLKERRTPQHSRVMYYRAASAASALSAGIVDDELLAHSHIVHLTGITPALSVGAADAVRVIIKRARALGARVSVDINYRSALWSPEAAGSFIRSIAPQVDVLFGSLDEFALIDRRVREEADAIDAAAALGVPDVIVKLGAHGAIARVDGQVVSAPAYRVDVVDTVGAGDAFVGGYLSGWVAGLTASERLDRAVRCGALQCTVSGDWEGSPTLVELALLDGGDPVSR